MLCKCGGVSVHQFQSPRERESHAFFSSTVLVVFSEWILWVARNGPCLNIDTHLSFRTTIQHSTIDSTDSCAVQQYSACFQPVCLTQRSALCCLPYLRALLVVECFFFAYLLRVGLDLRYRLGGVCQMIRPVLMLEKILGLHMLAAFASIQYITNWLLTQSVHPVQVYWRLLGSLPTFFLAIRCTL